MEVKRGSGLAARRIDPHGQDLQEKNVVKITFAKGGTLEDPSGLFNSNLDGNTRRAADFHVG